MAIVTKPADFIKGTPATYTLNKGDLAADIIVAADSYFSLQANWKNVSVIMKSTAGGQTKPLLFNATLATPTADFDTSLTARDDFEVDRLTIFDFDGGQLTLLRGDLNTSDFDVSVAPPVIATLFEAAFNGANLDSDSPVITPTATSVILSGARASFPVTILDTALLSYETLSPLTLGQTGSINYDIEFRYDSIGGGSKKLLSIHQDTDSNFNQIQIDHRWSSNFPVTVKDSSGTTMISGNHGSFDPNLSQIYDFAWEWDLTGGIGVGWIKMYIDEVLNFTALQTAGTTRTDNVSYLGFASALENAVIDGAALFLDNIKIYNTPQK